MPRFVILLHETQGTPRPTHYDLMFEAGGSLWTWAVEKIPAPGETQIAERLSDHRLAYLDYEGEISANRGRVQRVGQGTYELTSQSPHEIALHLRGDTVTGTLTLSALSDDPHRWRVSLSTG
jgi:hypothetical protein